MYHNAYLCEGIMSRQILQLILSSCWFPNRSWITIFLFNGIGVIYYLIIVRYLNDTLETSWWRVVFAVPALLCLIRQLVITVIYRMESPLSLKNDDCKILLAKIYKPDCVD